ncbi:MAG: hypothetical protein AB8H79_15600 [Myxococcota bacterium]
MDPRATADHVHTLLDQAGHARTQGRHAACIEHLTQAQAALSEADLPDVMSQVSWRLSKAHYDFGTPEGMLDAVTPLLEAGQPFHGNPGARRALSTIAKRWWDSRGYADDRVAKLWGAWAQSYADDSDPWMQASGETQRARHVACAGNNEELDSIIEHYLTLDPKRFGVGPHRHPSAPDTPSSVWWAQLELLRIGLWHATWSQRADRAIDLLDSLEDAAEAAEIDRASDPWFLDPACRAAIAFGWADVLERYSADWLRALRALDHPRAAFHLALATGSLPSTDPADAIAALQEAIHLADTDKIGAEWRIDARLSLANRLSDSEESTRYSLRQQAAEIAASTGVGAFPTS